MSIAIAAESPLQDDVRAPIAELNEALLKLMPPEHYYHLTAEEMVQADRTVFVGRESGEAIAIGALKRHCGIGEVKRMYTRRGHRGHGIGGHILHEIQQRAASDGLNRLVLETGDRHPAAWRVYERAGFKRCGPVLDYPDSQWSVFYERPLMHKASAA